MTLEQLQNALVTAGLTCRVKNDEVALEVCYFCGNPKYNLELSPDKGLYYCWTCRKGGRLDELLSALTGQVHRIEVNREAKSTRTQVAPAANTFKSQQVADVPSALHYLGRRGITQDLATQYGMVVCTEPGHLLEGRIAIPAKNFWTGALLGWIGRTYTGARPKYLSTMVQKEISGWRARDRNAPALLIEGHLDGIAAHRAGFHAAVLSGTGTGGITDWASRLPPELPVVIMLDGSATEQARRLLWQIRAVRSAPVVMAMLEAEADPSSLGPEGVRDAAMLALGVH